MKNKNKNENSSIYSTLIIDAHPLFRAGLKQLLDESEEFDLIGETNNGEDGIEIAQDLNPDLILLNLHLPGINGIETISELRANNIESKVVILTASKTAENLVSAIRAGCDGYILKSSEPEAMLDMIYRALHGHNPISPELSGILANVLKQESTEGRCRSDVTNRELEVLKCLAHGMSNRMIAQEFNIVESTVKIHIRNILRKLRFRSRVEAAVWAVSNNIGTDFVPKSEQDEYEDE